VKPGVWPGLVLCLAALPLRAAEITVTGRVIDENEAAVSGVQITVSSAAVSASHTVSDPTGRFTIPVPSAGDYLFDAECAGFFPLKALSVQVREGGPEVHLVLNHAKEILQSVDVTAAPSPIDVEQTDSERRLSGIQILDVPYPSTHSLRNAMSIMPGVIEDPSGGLHFDGGKENQTNYLLDGFNISDPLTGLLDARVSVESVQALDYLSGRYSPEFGKGSAGTLQIKTENGDDQFRYSATNFIPGVDTQKGLHLGAWTPRANLSGPILKGRAWFSDSMDGDYSILIVPELPKGQDQSASWQASNILHSQVNLTPANILFGDFLFNYDNAARLGLSALDPPSTTTDLRIRTWFVGIKDQMYIARDTLLELGFGELFTFLRQIPQGDGIYVVTPNGRQGDYFLDSTQHSRRGQFFGNLFLPAFHFAGGHQFKTGFDVDRLDYSQDFTRTGYELFGVSQDLLRSVTFGGNGDFSRPSLEASSYLLDDWRVRPNLTFEIGVRQDWDELIRRAAWSPRASFSYGISDNTRISGGYAVVYDPTTLQLFTRPLDQYSLADVYAPDGTLLRANSLTLFTLGNQRLSAPRVQNWTLGVDHLFPRRIRVNVSLLRRLGSDQFAYVNTLSQPVVAPPDFAATYQASYLEQIFNLTNARHDEYDSAQVTVHQPFGGRYEWMASYTRSRTHSNDVVEQTIDQPLVVQGFNNTGPLPWDAPNRFLSWGYLPTLWKNWAVSYLLEMRCGFPFSVQHDNGDLFGTPDSYRFPDYFNLNLHAEWRFHFRQTRFALRGGFNNITNHRNPTTVNSTLESPQFLTFYGSEGRHFVVRLRWLGKESAP
jgi:hypothetical protein